MKPYTIIVFLLLFFFCPSSVWCEDRTLGKIVESIENGNVIQVGTHVYRVGIILIDNGLGEPVMGIKNDLKEGDLVEIIAGLPEASGLHAEKVIKFIGSKREKVMQELE